MNFLKKGPELKLSSLKALKAPEFLGDLYYDLRERRLLPLVAMLAVAIVAVPILMGKSSEPEAPDPSAAIASTSAALPRSSNLVVAKAAPGLRDYRKRLDDHGPQDPFEQQYASGKEEGGTSATESGVESSTGSEAPETTYAPPEDGDTTPGPGKLTYYSFAIDVRVTSGEARASASAMSDGSAATEAEEATSSAPKAAASAKGEATVRRNLPQLTMLPSRKTPAAIFMGVTKDEKKALLMVSSDVRGIFGDAVCVLGSQTCQMVAVEPGLPTTFIYGPQERAFKIEVLKIRIVATDELNRAPLGKPKKKKGE